MNELKRKIEARIKALINDRAENYEDVSKYDRGLIDGQINDLEWVLQEIENIKCENCEKKIHCSA